MSAVSDIDWGTISLTNGSTAVTGVGTTWSIDNLRNGDWIVLIVGGENFAPPIIDSASSDTSLTLVTPWAGPDLTNVKYRIRYQWNSSRVSAMVRRLVDLLDGGNLQAFAGLAGAPSYLPMFTGPGAMTLVSRADLVSGANYDVQVPHIAARAAYDNRPGPTEGVPGFAVLVANTGDGRAAIYSKLSNASADWSDPAYVTGPAITLDVTEVDEVPYGTPPDVTLTPVAGGYGLSFEIPRGMIIEPGTTTTLASDQPANVTFVPVPGGYRLDIAIPRGPTGNIDGVTPFWVTRLGSDANAAAARAGLGAGDFAGPNGGVVDGELVAFNGTTGKAGKGTGLLPQASRVDSTANRLMVTGAFGIGLDGANQGPPSDDFNALRVNGVYRCTAVSIGTPFGSMIGQIIHAGQAGNYAAQIAMSAQSSAVFYRNLNNNVWSSWKRVYEQSSILGTVSQVSGVPSGAIIERGSNANGEYVRYADGTQICWQTITTPHPNGTLVNGAYVSDFVDTPMPATFVSVPVGGAFFLNTGFSFWMTGGPLNTNTWRTRALGMATWAAGNTGPTYLFSIGRWF